MNSEEFKEKIKQGFDKVVTSSKAAIGKAGSAMQDFGDKSVVKIEKHQLEQKREKEYQKLGEFVSTKLLENSDYQINSSITEVQEILDSIKNLNEKISEKDAALSEEKKSDSSVEPVQNQ